MVGCLPRQYGDILKLCPVAVGPLVGMLVCFVEVEAALETAIPQIWPRGCRHDQSQRLCTLQ